MGDNIAFTKADLLTFKSFVTEEIYSFSRIMDRIRTEYDQSKILEKNENLRSEISSKDLIITNSLNNPNSIRSTESTEKIVDREKFEFSQEKKFVSFNPKRP